MTIKTHRIKIENVNIIDEHTMQCDIPLDWMEIKCGLCGNEAFRIEGIIGGNPEIKSSNEGLKGFVVICNQCTKHYELIEKKEGI